MAARNEGVRALPPAWWRWPALIVVAIVALWVFPLFHVVPLHSSSEAVESAPGAFEPDAFAEKFWSEKLQPAAAHATDAATVLNGIRRDAKAEAARHAHQVGLGGVAYYFVHGSGRVVAQTKNSVTVAIDAADGATIALQTGPIFGNTVRDGCGLLDVNSFPGLQEFNALAASLNALVESRVLPELRTRATVGATVVFAGCAEAPETAAANAGDPLLSVVPVHVEFSDK